MSYAEKNSLNEGIVIPKTVAFNVTVEASCSSKVMPDVFESALVFEILKISGEKDNMFIGLQHYQTFNYFESVEFMQKSISNVLKSDPTIVAYKATLCSVVKGIVKPRIAWKLHVKDSLM